MGFRRELEMERNRSHQFVKADFQHCEGQILLFKVDFLAQVERHPLFYNAQIL